MSNKVNDRRLNVKNNNLRNKRLSVKERRMQLLHYKKMAFRFGIALVLIFGVVLGLCSERSYATQNNNTKFVKNYKSVEVKCGETLQSYADLYMSIEFETKDKFIAEVVSINHLHSDTIHAGEYLIIPYYSAQ